MEKGRKDRQVDKCQRNGVNWTTDEHNDIVGKPSASFRVVIDFSHNTCLPSKDVPNNDLCFSCLLPTSGTRGTLLPFIPPHDVNMFTVIDATTNSISGYWRLLMGRGMN